MSSLIYCTDATQAIIATDTLAVLPGGQRLLFTSKAFMVPHLRMVIAGTGTGRFASEWALQVSDGMLVRDVSHLDDFTPEALRRAWSDFKLNRGLREGTTTTVYHFGIDESGSLRIFIYRSTNDFRSESQQAGVWGAKPDCNLQQELHIPDDFVKLMDEQRALQELEPEEERIYIGGEIQVMHLSVQGITCSRLHRFGDYEADWMAMTNNLRP